MCTQIYLIDEKYSKDEAVKIFDCEVPRVGETITFIDGEKGMGDSYEVLKIVRCIYSNESAGVREQQSSVDVYVKKVK